MKKVLIVMMISIVSILTACKEEPKLKTVDYWLEHKQEAKDYWVANCREAMSPNDDCKVLRWVQYGNEKLARETYDSIVRERTK